VAARDAAAEAADLELATAWTLTHGSTFCWSESCSSLFLHRRRPQRSCRRRRAPMKRLISKRSGGWSRGRARRPRGESGLGAAEARQGEGAGAHRRMVTPFSQERNSVVSGPFLIKVTTKGYTLNILHIQRHRTDRCTEIIERTPTPNEVLYNLEFKAARLLLARLPHRHLLFKAKRVQLARLSDRHPECKATRSLLARPSNRHFPFTHGIL
jgi:hypothetical protein